MRKHPVLSGAALLLMLIVIVAGVSGKRSGGGGGQGSESSSAATTSTAAPAQSRVKTTPKLPHTARCGDVTRVGRDTSCLFAAEVLKAYVTGAGIEPGTSSATVVAWSPVTHKRYTMACSPRSTSAKTIIVCTGGKGALVTFPTAAVEQSRHAVSEAREQSEEAGPPAEEPSQPSEESTGGADAVGSPSHEGDQQFCEEHECIGNFTEEPGTVVECADGTYSHAGGISGACSDHGGVGRE